VISNILDYHLAIHEQLLFPFLMLGMDLHHTFPVQIQNQIKQKQKKKKKTWPLPQRESLKIFMFGVQKVRP
jgi:hypothetical protein